MSPSADHDLLQAYLDGELSDEQRAALEACLRAEPALADALLKFAREEAILMEWARAATSAAREPALAAGTGAQADKAAFSLPYGIVRRHPRVALLTALPAAMLLIAACALFLGWNREDATPAYLAQLEEFQGDVKVITPEGPVTAERGQELFSGQGLRTEGEGSFAVVKYADATRLELSTDTLIDLLGDSGRATKGKPAKGKKVFLQEGALSAEVAEQPEGRPMVLLTPHAEARLQKTRFSSASGQDATRIELDEGRIQFMRKSDGKVIDVPSGCYAVASLPPEPFAPRPLPAHVNNPKASLKDRTGPVMSVAFASDGGSLLIGSWDGSVTRWDATTDQVHPVIEGRGTRVSCLTFSRDRQVVAIGSERTLRLWDVPRGQELLTIELPRGRVACIALSPDCSCVAAGCRDKTVRLWDTATGKLQKTLRGFKGEVLALVFSPDGQVLATVGGQGKDFGEAFLWAVSNGEQLASLVGHTKVVRSVSFAPDGKTIVTASHDTTVRIWDVATGQEQRSLRGRARQVTFVSSSPDGRALATISNDGAVRLWDLENGRERKAYKAPKHLPYCVAFSPDGKTLASGGWDRTVRLWDASNADNSPVLSLLDDRYSCPCGLHHVHDTFPRQERL